MLILAPTIVVASARAPRQASAQQGLDYLVHEHQHISYNYSSSTRSSSRTHNTRVAKHSMQPRPKSAGEGAAHCQRFRPGMRTDDRFAGYQRRLPPKRRDRARCTEGLAIHLPGGMVWSCMAARTCTCGVGCGRWTPRLSRAVRLKRNMSRGNSLSDELDLRSVLGDIRAYLYCPVLG